ncbi:MAG TPA: NAD(P)H-quinone oxidoreductase [Gemmatimonadales bacterium]|nr:NAD(P)H-quinone oxidoreductase [Gemmatimonadales bacterium]
MRAAIYRDNAVLIEERPAPTPRTGEILVRVHASALNRADLLQRKGRYPAPAGWPADIGGLEYAGTVEALGPEVTRWRPGDRVMGLVGGGGHAEYVVVHQDEALAVPDALDWSAAAAVPEAFLTAWDALVARGRLAAGERVLLHAAASGVGTAAVQLAKQLGATVLGTSRSAEKLAALKKLGLDVAIDTSATGFRAQIHEPVHVIVDPLGAPAFADNLALLAPLGRLVLLGFLQGSRAEQVELDIILRQRLTVVGTAMRTRSLAERAALMREFTDRVLPLLAAGKVRPVVGATVSMTGIAEAHAAMERNETFGKVVLTW